MDIGNLMRRLHAAEPDEKERISEEIRLRFSALSESDKEKVREEFSAELNDTLKEADELMRRTDAALAVSEIAKYVSLSKIANDYFGKSKEWLYQRIKGYLVNGKPAAFTEEERKRLSAALEDVSRKVHETSLKLI